MGIKLRLTIVDTPGKRVNCHPETTLYTDNEMFNLFRFWRRPEFGGNKSSALRLHRRTVQKIFPGRERPPSQINHRQSRPLLPLLHSTLRSRVRSIFHSICTSNQLFFYLHCRMRMIDVAAMKKLHKKVNLVPVIAKADSLTKTELNRIKSQILAELKQYEIQVSLLQ